MCGRPAGSSKLVAYQAQVLRFELLPVDCCKARRRAFEHFVVLQIFKIKILEGRPDRDQPPLSIFILFSISPPRKSVIDTPEVSSSSTVGSEREVPTSCRRLGPQGVSIQRRAGGGCSRGTQYEMH